MPPAVHEYVVGFKIFEGKSLQTEDGGPCDPFVLVECCDFEFRTATLESKVTKSLVQWNEGFIWPDIQLHPQQFEAATIEFSVYARYWITRNYLIGKASMQLSFINNRPRHLYARTWLQLKREDCPECTGELNISVYALKPGQQAPSATEQTESCLDTQDEEGEDIDDMSKHVLKATPEAPTGRQHHVRLVISRVEDLRDLALSGGPPSPYITVEFAGFIVQTARGECVSMFTFNEEIVIPVAGTIYEDLIIIKLWTSGGYLLSDELIAQGNISFRALRNEAMPPRWFNLYGWNEEEIPDPAALAESGIELKPNYYKGRLLLSGRVEALKEGEELQRAARMPARSVPDPGTTHLVLLADVYMVTGIDGQRCRVEVSFGPDQKSTVMVDYDEESIAARMNGEDELRDMNQVAEMEAPHLSEAEDVSSFTFDEKNGRIDPLLVVTPEDPESQPRILINVYTDGYIQSERRVGYASCSVGSFPMYDHGSPCKPRFIPLEPMPDGSTRRIAPAVLMAIERHHAEDVARHSRKTIRPMIYIVRSYCFLARRITYDGVPQASTGSHFSIRVSCAGMSRTTAKKVGPRPMWMESMDLRVFLCSNSVKEKPTIEPITVTLVEQGTLLSSDVGQATCVYTHLRRRDHLGRWEPFKLEPQWIQLEDVNDGRPVGEILIAFELLTWRHRDEPALQARDMWPQPEAVFDEREHFCKLKKATLHFSLQGLRDVVQLPNMESLGFMSGLRHVAKPTVTVEVKRFYEPDPDLIEEKKLEFRYRGVLGGGETKGKGHALQQWRSKIGKDSEGTNFEFFQSGKMNVLIPDKMLFQPYVTIKVLEEPDEVGLMGSALGYDEPTFIGESLQSLADRLPCCWLKGVTLDRTYQEQWNEIQARLKEAKEEAQVRTTFKQLSEGELKRQLKEAKESTGKVKLDVRITSAHGLGAANPRCAYCTCEVRGKSGPRIRTGIGKGISTVVWDHEASIHFAPNDVLLFRVRDKERPSAEGDIGCATLASTEFYPGGFEGDLTLKGPWGSEMRLTVKVSTRTKDSEKQSTKWTSHSSIGPPEPEEFVNAEGLPLPLRSKCEGRRALHLGTMDEMNMGGAEGFSPRKGAPTSVSGEEHKRKVIHGKLENTQNKLFHNDFWYKAMPLLRNHDIVVAEDEDIDWYFQPEKTFGFVKCAFKLVDGWDDEEAYEGAPMMACLSYNSQRQWDAYDKGVNLLDQPVQDSLRRLRCSFAFDEDLNSYAFDEKKLEEKFTGASAVPTRVRVRLYLVKAVCLFGKSSGFADPYIAFQLGRNISVSMKNMIKSQTNTPEFYHTEERDIHLPVDSRLEIMVMDYDDMQETLIGSTVIDLEDRWHSPAWRDFNAAQTTPMENRPLYTPDFPGKNRGSIEMWIEMIESTKSSEVPAADIRKPAEIEVEVRFVIWGTKDVKLWKDGVTNVKLSARLDCKEYNGEHPALQETDIHYKSKDGKAVFNWRIVYPKIQMPALACSVQFSLFHAETFGDDLIGTLDFNLQEYLISVSRYLTARVVGPGDLSFQSVDSPDDEHVGSVSLSIYVMTQIEAACRKQGLGQSEPNDDPQLLTPIEGREWGDYISSWNIPWPDFSLFKKALPLIASAGAFLLSVVALRKMGVL